jgi:hypothetical protein
MQKNCLQLGLALISQMISEPTNDFSRSVQFLYQLSLKQNSNSQISAFLYSNMVDNFAMNETVGFGPFPWLFF